MASLFPSSSAPLLLHLRRPPPSLAIGGSRPAVSSSEPRISLRLSLPHASRLVIPMGRHAMLRTRVVFASNVTQPNQDSGKNNAEVGNSTVADGPPLATILAGLLVFLFVFWVIGSILLWLAGLFISRPSS